MTFKKFADLLIKVEQYNQFRELAQTFDITIETAERATIERNGKNIPQPFYFVNVSFMNDVCLFELGYELGKLTLH